MKNNLLSLLVALVLASIARASLTTRLVVLARDGTQVATASATAPESISKVLSVSEEQSLGVSVSGESLKKDAIVFAHFVHSTLEDVEVSLPLELKKGKHVLQMKKGHALNQFKKHPGQYSVSIYSTESLEQVKNVGSVVFNLARLPEPHVIGSTESYEPLKEIFHIFRKPEKMPNVMISVVFAALVVVVPWALLVISWSALKVNVSNLSQSSSNLVWGGLFLASLAACSAFFVVYWVQLNLFQLMGYGSILWTVAAFFGRQALVTRAALRLKGKK
ncbi:dolichyl-diphosphooligosaccharide---protein glycotransferase [Chytriomyces confervae]|uniref:Dolichyl-diphosphooligosaccharide---protein glycotransferase n=1 Tax=Chytriomyces confervae TaxID=246404 RepID=A0A507FCV3_9FUNG|nr:dolichyl-diphosphooligosaccharide---protein glycotransferase [Chytriomyces confervae]